MIHSWSDPGRSVTPPGADRLESAEDQLVTEYEGYCRRQSRRLVSLLPREAIRPLYRAACEDSALTTEPNDPLGLLSAYCARLLPLPPFDVWLDDVRSHPEAYLVELMDAADAPSALAPATIETRSLSRKEGAWVARLRGFRDADVWRGFIAFEDEGSRTVHRTALIFREGDPRDLRRRFLGFESATLEAFLRSSLP